MTPEENARLGITLILLCASLPFSIGLAAGAWLQRRITRLGWWAVLPGFARSWYERFNDFAKQVLAEEETDK